MPERVSLDESTPFGIGKDLIVDVPVDARGIADVYIDDIIGLTIDIPGSNNATRLERAILLALHTAARPVHPDEPIPRESMAALAKLIAEAGLEETKTILGWYFDFRTLTVKLPLNKFTAWSNAIKSMIGSKSATAKELECNIGRLVHLSMVIPTIHHFMSRLRELHTRSLNRSRISINQTCIEDLKLMLYFLEKAKEGVDMNLIVYRRPDRVYRSDSCPAGLGGYSDQGFAWRWYIEQELQGRASNNLLEHIASIITVWIDIINGRLKHGDCSLSMTDSTTSEGWTRKTNFKEDREDPIQATVRIQVAREHATRLMEHGIKDYSQWFPGKENDVADALSRDDDRDDEELTQILHSHVPSQMPRHFEIVPLPNEISSWLTSLLRKLPVKEQLQERHTRTKLGRGGDGSNGASQLDSTMTSTLTTSQDINESNSLEPLPWLCGKHDFQERLMIPWLKAQSEVPFHMWHRPSGRTTDQTPQGMKMASLADFYLANSGRSETQTHHQGNKKPSPSVY